MVERLKVAIEKARASRAGGASAGQGPGQGPGQNPGQNPGQGMADPPWAPERPGGAPAGAPEGAPGGRRPRPAATGAAAADPWLALEEITLDPRALLRERIVTRDKSDPAHIAFDALRTRLLKALHDNRWSRVAITSPTKGCGKTMVACNLAFSLARQPESRCMLVDLDLRMPQIAARLGQPDAPAIEPYLLGEVSPRDYFRRAGANLAIGLNSARVWNAAELVQSRRVAATLASSLELFRPTVVLFDMPPMLTSDDVLAFLPNIDGVILVVGGGQTRAGEIEECERLMAEHTNFLGVVLNKAEDSDLPPYRYEDA
jgi:Mrp family chromosome partitioning ATPase